MAMIEGAYILEKILLLWEGKKSADVIYGENIGKGEEKKGENARQKGGKEK